MRTTDYFNGVIKSLEGVSEGGLDRIAAILFGAYKTGNKVIVFGNGGSAATASHFVCDLAKGASIQGKKRFRAFSLNDNVPMVMAYGNDSSYDDIFSEQLENIVEKGDVVIGISASGNSKNVLKAIKYANSKTAITVGLTGFQGGALKGLASECLVVPGNTMEQIEDCHLIILHALKMVLRSRIEKAR